MIQLLKNIICFPITGIIHSIGYKRNVFYVGDLFSRTTTSITNPCDSPVCKVFVHKQELADAKTLHNGSSLQEWA
jgi:hypothetical protein